MVAQGNASRQTARGMERPALSRIFILCAWIGLGLSAALLPGLMCLQPYGAFSEFRTVGETTWKPDSQYMRRMRYNARCQFIATVLGPATGAALGLYFGARRRLHWYWAWVFTFTSTSFGIALLRCILNALTDRDVLGTISPEASFYAPRTLLASGTLIGSTTGLLTATPAFVARACVMLLFNHPEQEGPMRRWPPSPGRQSIARA